MTKFYIIICVISAVLFAADMILRYMEKISNFGMERELFRFKGKTISYELFLPKTLNLLFFSLLIFGIVGLALDLFGVRFFLSLPAALLCQLLLCYFVQSPVKKKVDRVQGKGLPRGDKAVGIDGYAAELIPGDGYGMVEFEYKGERYRVNAVSAYDTDIPEYEPVVIVYEEDEMYVVESVNEIYRIESEPY